MSHSIETERAVWERVRAGRDAPPMPRQEQPPMPEPPVGDWCPLPEHKPPMNDCCHKPEQKPPMGGGCHKPEQKPPMEEGCQEPSCQVTPEQLLDWICHECRDAGLYRHLARCLPRARRCLLELAGDEQCHARRLAAHYYAITGCHARVQADFTPGYCPLEILRRRHAEEAADAKAYLDAAHCATGQLAELLEELARDEARHSRTVLCLLECVM